MNTHVLICLLTCLNLISSIITADERHTSSNISGNSLSYWTVFSEISRKEYPNLGTKACTAIPWIHTCEENGYDKMAPPEIYHGRPTPVQIEVYVESIGNFKTTTMDYDMDIYFVEFWKDHRLGHTHDNPLSIRDKKMLDQIWLPDIYFANSKFAQYNFVTVPNCILKLRPDGTIRYSVRIHLKIACHMNLKSYPIDTQLCYLKVLTYGSTESEVNVSWISDSPITLNPEITQSDLKVSYVAASYCNGTYFGMDYSCLLVTFHLKRDLGYSLLQVYLPTSFIVAISWISFWIDPCSVPGRVGLAVTTLLTLSTQAIGLHYHLPPVGYAKAQDIWFGMCILFLFAALVEFALVNMFLRQSETAEHEVRRSLDKRKSWFANVPVGKKRSAVQNPLIQEAEGVQTVTNAVTVNPVNGTVHDAEQIGILAMEHLISNVAKMYRSKAIWTDRVSRIAFPAVFLLFCIAYWCAYWFRPGANARF